jgi:hypothetical protein
MWSSQIEEGPTVLLPVYIVSSILFLVGLVGYWVVTRSFRDTKSIYETAEPEIANH